MNQKYNCVIGIDPGVSTGFAVWLPSLQKLSLVGTFGIIEAIEWVVKHNTLYGNILVRIENPNLRKWFGNTGREKLQGAGSIKRDYSIWKGFFEKADINYQDVAPRSIKTKVSADYFRKLTGWEGRTSSHARDAAMMVYGYK